MVHSHGSSQRQWRVVPSHECDSAGKRSVVRASISHASPQPLLECLDRGEVIGLLDEGRLVAALEAAASCGLDTMTDLLTTYHSYSDEGL